MRYKEELDKNLIDWKMSLEILKNFLTFISLSIKYLRINMEYYSSYFLFLKMSDAPFTHTVNQ